MAGDGPVGGERAVPADDARGPGVASSDACDGPDDPGVTELTPDSALERVLAEGFDARAAARGRARAESAARLAGRAGRPDLWASGAAGLDAGTDGSGFTPALGAGLRSTTALYAGGGIRAGQARAEADRAAAEAEIAQVRIDVRRTVTTGLLALAAARELEAVAAANLAAEEATGARVAAAAAAGARTRADVLLQEASVARARADLVGARRNARLAELGVAELVRLPPGTPLRVCGLGHAIPAPRSIDVLVAEARAASPTLDALRAAVEAARADIDAARARGRPAVDLVGSARATAPLAGGTTPALTAGLALDLAAPLADRGRTEEGVTVAELALADAQDALARADEALALRVHAVVEDVRAAVAGVAAARAAREAAEAALAVVEARYDAGAGVMADLLAARAGALAAQVADTRAGWELVRSRVELEAVLARP